MDAEQYDALPQEVKDILDTHNGDECYIQCQRIVDELKLIGWTCDYDLGSGIYDVKPIGEV